MDSAQSKNMEAIAKKSKSKIESQQEYVRDSSMIDSSKQVREEIDFEKLSQQFYRGSHVPDFSSKDGSKASRNFEHPPGLSKMLSPHPANNN